MAAAHCATAAAAATLFFHFPPARKNSVIAYAIPTRFPSKPTKRKNYLRPKILKTITKPYPIPHKISPENPFLPTEEQEQQQRMEMEFSADEFVIREVKESGRNEEQESPEFCSGQLSSHEVEGSYPIEVQQEYSSGEFSGEEVKDSAPVEQEFASHCVEGSEGQSGFPSEQFSGEGMKVFHSDIPFDQFVSEEYGESGEKVEVSEMGEFFRSGETISSPEFVKPIAGNSFSSFSKVQIGLVFVAACVIDTIWSTWMAKKANSIKKDQNSSIIDGNNKPKSEHLLNEIKDGNNKPNSELLLKENKDGSNKPSSEQLKENNVGNNKPKSELLSKENVNSIGIRNEGAVLNESEMDKKIAEIRKLAREAREKEKLKSEGKGVNLDDDEYGEDDVVPIKLEKSFKKKPLSPEGLAAEEERKTLMFKKKHRLKSIGIDAKNTRPKGLTSTQDHGMTVIKTNGKLQNGPNDNDFVVLNRDELNLPRVDLLDNVSTASLEEEKGKKLLAKKTVRKQSSPRKKIVKERAQTTQRVTTSEQLNKSQGDVLGNSSFSLEEDRGKKLPAEESKQIQGSRKKYVKERRHTKPSVTSSEQSTVQEQPVSLEAQIFRNFIQSKKHDRQESVSKKRDDLNVQKKPVSLEAQIFRNFIQSKNHDMHESVSKKHGDLNVNGNGKLKVKEVGAGKANNGLGGQKSYDNTDFWWLSLPYVLAIVLQNDGGRSAGVYTLRITSQGMDDISYRVAFEDHSDATNFCHILEDFFEELVGFNAGITSIPTKELEEALKSKNMKVLVVKKGQVKLYAGQLLTDVEKELRSLVNQN